eukprot:Gb_08697 [translate_table: standard]
MSRLTSHPGIEGNWDELHDRSLLSKWKCNERVEAKGRHSMNMMMLPRSSTQRSRREAAQAGNGAAQGTGADAGARESGGKRKYKGSGQRKEAHQQESLDDPYRIVAEPWLQCYVYVGLLKTCYTAWATSRRNANNGTTHKTRRFNLVRMPEDMLIVGVETSAMTMEWCMAELLRNPHVTKKSQEDIKSIVDKDRRGWCIQPALQDQAYGDRVGYSDISRNVGDPLAFNSERFMGRDVNVKGQTFELLQFGSRRPCPGASLTRRRNTLIQWIFLVHASFCTLHYPSWATMSSLDNMARTLSLLSAHFIWDSFSLFAF